MHKARSLQSSGIRLFRDCKGVWENADRRTALAYLLNIGRNLPAIFRTGTLLPADAAMAGRSCLFSPLTPGVIALDGSHFSGAREMYCRRVYFARPGFEVHPGDIVLDIGANRGLFTILAAVYGGRVVAVEAQSGFLPIIEANLERNECRHRATLELALIGAGRGLLSKPATRSAASHWGDEPSQLTIPEVIVRHALPQVDLMKVDIEGSEFAAFSGDLGWLDAVKRIVMEVHTEFGDVPRLANSLRNTGFKVELVDPDSGHVVDAIAGPDGYIFAHRPADQRTVVRPVP